MNHRGTEDAEKKKKNDEKKSLSLADRYSCFMLPLFLFVFIAITCWGIPLVTWSLKYLHWQSQDIDNYEIVLIPSGLSIPDYLEHVQVDDDVYQLKAKDETADIIELLFQDAFGILITTPLCKVNYHPKYSFPNRVLCYEGAGVKVDYFEPITNNQ